MDYSKPDLTEMPAGLKKVYKEERERIDHRVILNLRRIPYKEVEGVIKDIEIGEIDNDNQWNSVLLYAIETDKGMQWYNVLRDVQAISDLGVAEDLDRISELNDSMPGDIETIDDVANYMNSIIQGKFVGRFHKEHITTTYDDELPDVNYLAREIKKAVKNNIISWKGLSEGNHVCRFSNEKEFDRWLRYRST